MPSRYSLTLNTEGVRRLMLSDDVEHAMLDTANDLVQSQLNGSYYADSHKGRTRASAVISSASQEEFYRNLNSNTALKALSAYSKGGRRK